MELALYSMYKISLENLVRNKLFICKNYNIQPSEIDRMWYFEYETLVKEINEYQKKEEEEQKKQEKEQNKNMPNIGSMMSQQRQMQSNLMSNFSISSPPLLPQVSLPKF